MKHLEIGIDGNCIYVGLGNLPEPDSKFHFREIEKDSVIKRVPSMQDQRYAAYEEWCALYPEEGRLPFELRKDET